MRDAETILFFRPCCSDVLTFEATPMGKVYSLVGKYWRFVKDYDA